MDLLKSALIIKKCNEILKSEKQNLFTNLETKVTVSKEDFIDFENQTFTTTYLVVDQESIIIKKFARLTHKNDGYIVCEYSGFKDQDDILKSLNK